MNYGHAKKNIGYTAQNKIWHQLWNTRLKMEPSKNRHRSSNSSQSDLDYSVCPSLNSSEKADKQQKKKSKKMTKQMEEAFKKVLHFQTKLTIFVDLSEL